MITAEDFDHPALLRARFQELSQVWMIHLLQLLDRNSATTYLSCTYT